MSLNQYLNEKEFISRVLSATRSKDYLVVLARQLEQIENNKKSIECLISNECIQDAYTIFRKMLETFFSVNCILLHPGIATVYIKHLSLLSDRTIKQNMDDVRDFKEGKPDGYLEYGYVEGFVDNDEPDFKYTIRSVARAGEVEEMYNWYRISSNFVHNNLTMLKIDENELDEKLKAMIKQTFDTLETKLKWYMR